MAELKRRLIAGTINRYPAEDGWENTHLDKSDRPLYDLARRRKGAPAEIVCSLTDARWVRHGPFDEIRCHQVLEHLTPEEAPLALMYFEHALKPGGALDIEVPHVTEIINGWMREDLDLEDMLRNLYGSSSNGMPDDHMNAHRWGWSQETLTEALITAGFAQIEPVDVGYQLRLRAYPRP